MSDSRKVIEITLTLSDGENLVFPVKHRAVIRILKGTTNINTGNFVNKVLNNKEVLVIISAPENVLELFDKERDIWGFVEERLNK
jgi:redox-sensitive bicupin YhaK (pirin superfamily)